MTTPVTDEPDGAWPPDIDPSDCPGCGRDSCDGSCHDDTRQEEARPKADPKSSSGFIGGADFMAREAADPEVLVPRVAYEGCATMAHGRPRSLKSLAMMYGHVEVSAGLPWWGIYAPPRPLRVGLVLEEDGARLVRQRLTLMLAGLGLERLPDAFRIMVRSGLYLEDPWARSAFLRDVVEPENLDILLLDPTRSPFPGVDGGPEKGAPLRRFVQEALAVARSMQLIHHDIKPARDGHDGRARAEQASGGQILSIADVPIAFQRLSGRSALVEWSLVKVGADGEPLRLDFESETDHEGGFAGFLRCVAQATDRAAEGLDFASRERVRSWFADNPWNTPTDAASGLGMKREKVDRLLAQLQAAKLLRMETGAAAKARSRNRNAKLWGPFDA